MALFRAMLMIFVLQTAHSRLPPAGEEFPTPRSERANRERWCDIEARDIENMRGQVNTLVDGYNAQCVDNTNLTDEICDQMSTQLEAFRQQYRTRLDTYNSRCP